MCTAPAYIQYVHARICTSNDSAAIAAGRIRSVPHMIIMSYVHVSQLQLLQTDGHGKD